MSGGEFDQQSLLRLPTFSQQCTRRVGTYADCFQMLSSPFPLPGIETDPSDVGGAAGALPSSAAWSVSGWILPNRSGFEYDIFTEYAENNKEISTFFILCADASFLASDLLAESVSDCKLIDAIYGKK